MGTAWEVTAAIGLPRISSDAPQEPRIRVVVVDDSPAYLEVICALLELADVVDVVGRANNGAEAISAVAKLQPDLLLMDIQMPLVNGPSAAAFLSVVFPRTKIVLMSAEDPEAFPEVCEACGAQAFIHKAEFRREFMNTLGALFEQHRGWKRVERTQQS
jgi:DNA-binding NarL/FixJ family response regulator